MINYPLYSFNVRGLRDTVKRKVIFKHLQRKNKAAIFLLQETHSSTGDERVWGMDWNGIVHYSHGVKTDACGVMIMLSPGLNVDITNIIRDKDGRFIAMHFKNWENEDTLLCNIYAPTRNKVQLQLDFLNMIKSKLAEVNFINLILGGDFNTIFDPLLDKSGGDLENCTNRYTKELQSFMETYDLIDALRFCYPDKRIYTRAQRKPVVLTRIDHWLISSQLCNAICEASVLPGIKSDHSIIHIDLGKDKHQRGKGFWKFNSQYLKDTHFIEEMNKLIDSLKTDTIDMQDKGLRWDFIQNQLRGFCLKYSFTKSKEKHELRTKLEKDIHNLEIDLNTSISEDKIDLLQSFKHELENLEEIEVKGAILRAKVRWAEAGEKNTKYFLNLEKRNSINKHITRLQLNDGSFIDNPKEILKEEKLHFQKLYMDKDNTEPDISNFVNRNKNQKKLPSLSEVERMVCEGTLSVDECGKALNELQNGKSPGTTGFTTEFYKFFWSKIKELVTDSLNYAFENGHLSIDQKRGIITLVPKKDKIRTLLKNWRPISLLNTDYKILTKCLSFRVQKVLPSLIDPDQTGFLKGRYIGENIRTIADIIDYTNLKNKPGIVLLIDFEKAFDTIRWSFIVKALTLFNFGSEFIQWVKTLYKDIESTVINNGHSAGFFKLQRGIRQGCPLSPYLFILAVEIMAHAIRSDDKIKGIEIGLIELKLSQLADDTTIFVSDFSSIGQVLRLLQEFHSVSGLKTNVDKTIAKCIGSLSEYETNNMYKLHWTKGYVKTLGVTISNDSKVLIEENFMPRLQAMGNLLDIWQCRGLSLKGRVTILKSLVLPKLLYPMSVLPTPSYIIELVDNMILDFIWDKRKHKINKNVIVQEIQDGGLKVPKFSTMVESNRISWIKRYIQSSGKWKSIIQEIVKPFKMEHLIECNLSKEYIQYFPTPFYKQVFFYWNSIKCTPSNVKDFKNQIIWHNRFITVTKGPKSKQDKTLFWLKFYISGIVRVADLFVNGRFINTVQLYELYKIQTNFLNLHTLYLSLPIEWRASIESEQTESVSVENVNLNIDVDTSGKSIECVTVKEIYRNLIKRTYIRPTALNKWAEVFHIEDIDWSCIFIQCYISSRETKLQTLQYKIIHRIFPCQKWLYIHKVVDSPKCQFCEDLDDIIHYFTSCRRVIDFWNNLQSWWNNLSEYTIICTPKHILFGMYYDNEYYAAINHVILLAKSYIYNCNLHQKPMCFFNFLIELKKNLDIEENICTKRNTSPLFDKRWKNIYPFL